jgi:hypothetical protein
VADSRRCLELVRFREGTMGLVRSLRVAGLLAICLLVFAAGSTNGANPRRPAWGQLPQDATALARPDRQKPDELRLGSASRPVTELASHGATSRATSMAPSRLTRTGPTPLAASIAVWLLVLGGAVGGWTGWRLAARRWNR